MESDILDILNKQYNLYKYDIVDGIVTLNIYLELGNWCNCSCNFCCNQFFEKKAYNFKKIVTNLKLLLPFLKEIDIGGGEPTRKIDDLMALKRIMTDTTKLRYFTNYEILKAMGLRHIEPTIHNYLGLMSEILKSDNIYNKTLDRINFVVFSNGTSPLENYEALIDAGFTLAFSRHHYDEEKNKEIFKSSEHILSGDEVGSLFGKVKVDNYREESYYKNRHEIPYVKLKKKNIYFNCVLAPEGLNSIQDISDYLYWIAELQTGEYFGDKMDVVFSNLEHHSKCDEMAISNELIHSIDDWFTRDRGRIILSSSGYTITPYRFDVYNLPHKKQRFSVKEYLDTETSEEMWKHANASEYKKVIDLHMDSEGNIYQDYQKTKRLVI